MVKGKGVVKRCGTRAEVARVLGRHVSTIDTWIGRGMPGKRGRYDLSRIVGWAYVQGLLEVATPSLVKESARGRLDRLRGDEVELGLAVQRGQVVDAEPAKRLITRRVNEAKAILEQLPDRFAAELPEGIDAETRARVRTTAQRTLDDAFLLLAELPKSRPFNPLDDESVDE